jgi:hypothetical protein
LTGCVGFFAVAGARFFVTAFTGFSVVLGADFCVITCTMSSAFFWSWLARSNVEGANACARRSALEMAMSDAVANAQRAGRFPTKARLCWELCR